MLLLFFIHLYELYHIKERNSSKIEKEQKFARAIEKMFGI